MSIQIPILLLLLPHALGLASRTNHELTAVASNHENIVGSIFQDFTLIGIVVVLVGVGACCFYFRGFFGGQERSQETVVIQARGRQENRVAAPPPKRYEPAEEDVVVRTEPKNNAILDYFGSQKSPSTNTRPAEQIKQTSSPYPTKPSGLSQWEPTSSAITSCAVCSLFIKANEIPMIQVECLEDHCFHVGCLSQHRSKMTIEFAGNGLNKCPKCKQTYSPVVRIFCPSCKRNAISASLVDYSDPATGEIATQRIVGKFGPSCQNCRP